MIQIKRTRLLGWNFNPDHGVFNGVHWRVCRSFVIPMMKQGYGLVEVVLDNGVELPGVFRLLISPTNPTAKAAVEAYVSRKGKNLFNIRYDHVK